MFAAGVTAAFVLAACAAPADGPSPTTAPGVPAATDPAAPVNPARIDRVRTELPGGYEVAGLGDGATPVTLWGFGGDWAADPAECAALADPVADPATTRGWSGSGPGGIVYVAVSAGSPPDPALVDRCAQWALSSGHTSATVTLLAGPAVADAATTGMSTAATTVVEGGTETRSHADTFRADLADHVVFVTVVTDPGSPNPPLGQDFAAELLVKTVSALRS